MHTTTTIRIDGQGFQLEDGEDVGRLKERIVAAANAGSQFVEFITSGNVKVSVLVTPRSAVRFEVHERQDEDASEPWPIPMRMDLDLYALD
ncbi:hypothetical protein QFZ62_001919 [Clavibacter sp. B3I6]|uniref:hypothetical protein n=1 Tax=Clavibacter sp. B3I6 TaxID=3042268 RepID=UPI00277FC293|nr:hypothetical protein [Clavibacter sp. B3I6]MDQ0744611.1 hypothetical protein [Clavibacter sp. B3I6]